MTKWPVVAVLVAMCALRTGGTAAPDGVELRRVQNGGLQPEAVVDARGVLHLLYFNGEPAAGDLFYTTSRDAGSTFSPPVRVNSQGASAIATGTIRGGQLALGRSGVVYVGWTGSSTAQPRGIPEPHNKKPGAPYLYTRSNPAGTAFEAQRNLNDRGYGLDGGSLTADADGHVYAAWHAIPAEIPATNSTAACGSRRRPTTGERSRHDRLSLRNRASVRAVARVSSPPVRAAFSCCSDRRSCRRNGT